MKFHLGYILGLIVGLFIGSIVIFSWQNDHLTQICNPFVEKIVSLFKNENKIAISNQNKGFKDPIKQTVINLYEKLNINISCPKDFYRIFKLKNLTEIYSCLRNEVYIAIQTNKSSLIYNYLLDLGDGVYIIEYSLGDVYLPILYYYNGSNIKIYNKQNEIIKIKNYPLPLETQKILFIHYLTNLLNMNYSDDVSKLCYSFSYPLLNSKEVGNKTIYILSKKIEESIKSLSLPEYVNLFSLNISASPTYNIEICFGSSKLFYNLNSSNIKASSIKDLASKLCIYNNSLLNAYNILKWVDQNFEYDNERAEKVLKEKIESVIPPEEMLKIRKGICTDYSVFIDAVLLNCNITPYYLKIEYYNQDYGHAVAAIKYNDTYYILDQHLPIMSLKNYILKSYYCDNKSLKTVEIYKVDESGNKKLIEKLYKFDYTNIKPEDLHLNSLKEDLIKTIISKYGFEKYNNQSYYGKYILYSWDLTCTKYGLVNNPTAEKYLLDLFVKTKENAGILPIYFDLDFKVENRSYRDFGLKYNIHLYGG